MQKKYTELKILLFNNLISKNNYFWKEKIIILHIMNYLLNIKLIKILKIKIKINSFKNNNHQLITVIIKPLQNNNS